MATTDRSAEVRQTGGNNGPEIPCPVNPNVHGVPPAGLPGARRENAAGAAELPISKVYAAARGFRNTREGLVRKDMRPWPTGQSSLGVAQASRGAGGLARDKSEDVVKGKGPLNKPPGLHF